MVLKERKRDAAPDHPGTAPASAVRHPGTLSRGVTASEGGPPEGVPDACAGADAAADSILVAAAEDSSATVAVGTSVALEVAEVAAGKDMASESTRLRQRSPA